MPNYNEIFMTQFIQTLAQLSAGVVTAVFAVPVYSYYVKGNLFFSTNEYNEEYEISDINKEKSSNILLIPYCKVTTSKYLFSLNKISSVFVLLFKYKLIRVAKFPNIFWCRVSLIRICQI